ncbi:MAG TPA: aminoglycoside phosphotransferase family protein [Chloroflexota bacterium]|nr:aminoglycoside phosphotransferase family protein [Chloroflexota bacterium]
MSPHGFDLPADEHDLLRGAPPASALHWVERSVGPGARLADVRAMEGGTSSAIHAVTVEYRDRTISLVLRRFVRQDWLAEEPDLAAHEAEALRLAAAARIPTPRLVAVDETGDQTDVPAILMERLPGAIEWNPADLEGYLRRLAEPLPVLHAVPVPAQTIIPPYAIYEPIPRRPPPDVPHPAVWERAIEIAHGPPPGNEGTFIHRDYHPGNVLWMDGAVTGIVDWASAAIGTPEADVGHCRLNLHGAFGPAAADRFLEIYQEITGRREYHPYWDIASALGGREESDSIMELRDTDDFLTRAVARL